MQEKDEKGKILYVEDNIDNRTLIRRILVSEGYDLIEAKDAAEALHLIERSKPDLILMDINMPDLDGYTLTAKIRKTKGYELIPIIAITANVMRGDREKTIEAGCDGYIQKPIDIDDFLGEVQRFIARRTHV